MSVFLQPYPYCLEQSPVHRIFLDINEIITVFFSPSIVAGTQQKFLKWWLSLFIAFPEKITNSDDLLFLGAPQISTEWAHRMIFIILPSLLPVLLYPIPSKLPETHYQIHRERAENKDEKSVVLEFKSRPRLSVSVRPWMSHLNSLCFWLLFCKM